MKNPFKSEAIKCPVCGNTISDNALRCPYCGDRRTPKSLVASTILGIVIAIVFTTLAYAIFFKFFF